MAIKDQCNNCKKNGRCTEKLSVLEWLNLK